MRWRGTASTGTEGNGIAGFVLHGLHCEGQHRAEGVLPIHESQRTSMLAARQEACLLLPRTRHPSREGPVRGGMSFELAEEGTVADNLDGRTMQAQNDSEGQIFNA